MDDTQSVTRFTFIHVTCVRDKDFEGITTLSVYFLLFVDFFLLVMFKTTPNLTCFCLPVKSIHNMYP